jgi:polysaccharide pyruvyl transferase WcaK-like protein
MSNQSHESSSERIAILFGNLKGNLGDFAILQAMIHQITLAYPGRGIDVYAHPLVPIDAMRLEGFRQFNKDVEFPGTSYYKAATSGERLLLSSFLRRRIQPRMIESFAKQAESSFASFAAYEAIFFAGGDQWSGKELGLAMFGTLMALQRINPNLYSFPFSLKASIVGLYPPGLLKSYFSRLKQPVIVRDSLTKKIMDDLGVTCVHGADCVFSLPDAVAEVEPAAAREHERVLFVVKGQEEILATAIERLLAQSVRIEFLSTCPQEDDRIFHSLAKRFSIPYHTPATWQGVIAEFRASSLIVTNRLHGLILGSIARVPLLPVTDRKKSLAFARDADMPHHVKAATDVTRDLLEKALSDKELVLRQMRTYQELCRAEPNSPVSPTVL